MSPTVEHRWFAFLRAINTGNRRLTNDQLLAPFRRAGLDHVAAYQAAGNVTFVAGGVGDGDELEVRLERTLAAAYGFEVPTFVRRADELATAVEALPFAGDLIAATEGRVQITFLRDRPDDATIAEVMALVPDDDAVAFRGRHWFWLPRAGVSTSELPVSRIEQHLGPMTMRTVGTVERLLAKFGARRDVDGGTAGRDNS